MPLFYRALEVYQGIKDSFGEALTWVQMITFITVPLCTRHLNSLSLRPLFLNGYMERWVLRPTWSVG